MQNMLSRMKFWRRPVRSLRTRRNRNVLETLARPYALSPAAARAAHRSEINEFLASLRMPRKRIAGLGLLLAAAIGIAGGSAVAPAAGDAVRQMQSALAMLGLRSPGERVDTALNDVKGSPQQRALGKTFAPPPSQRALGKVFPAPADAPFARAAGPLGAADGFAPPFQPDLLSSPGVPLAFRQPDVLGPGGPGIPGGPGLPGPGGPPGTGTNPPTPVAPVPEPATWLMMMLGFALCGSALRRQRRVHSAVPACSPTG